MAEDIKRSDLLLSLIKLEKEKGFVSLVDVIAAKKAFKEGKSFSNEEIIDALKEFDVHYTESEDGTDYDEEEPTQEVSIMALDKSSSETLSIIKNEIEEEKALSQLLPFNKNNFYLF